MIRAGPRGRTTSFAALALRPPTRKDDMNRLASNAPAAVTGAAGLRTASAPARTGRTATARGGREPAGRIGAAVPADRSVPALPSAVTPEATA
ncbi:hypothetical protein GCM10010358_12050 [Streptomyces minutiscleroticus]|uniref:Uncharacterized protein n=1 Tax=Streptomyces minutiscleroticus TaxID=68238 RepID=A0A918KDY4_9ACTN|nr:hypothetical protein GCM10010358_12050 [Streptomyces minutiscleroticus]